MSWLSFSTKGASKRHLWSAQHEQISSSILSRVKAQLLACEVAPGRKSIPLETGAVLSGPLVVQIAAMPSSAFGFMHEMEAEQREFVGGELSLEGLQP
jgi:hypothetical protein